MAGDALTRVLQALNEAGCKRHDGPGDHCCPAHPDKNPSLSVSNGDGKVLLRCHAGAACTVDQIVEALGLRMVDLRDSDQRQGPAAAREQDWIFDDYHDEHGSVLYQKVRKPGKVIRFRRPGRLPGTWDWGVGENTRRVLFRLPGVLAAIREGRTVYVAEGEPDCKRLISLGHAATCNDSGASVSGHAGRWLASYTETLIGAHVVVIADNDAPGFAHARYIAKELTGKTASVTLVRGAVNRLKADFTDHVETGFGLDDLVTIHEDDEPADGEPGPDAAERVHQYEVEQELRKLRVRAEAKQLFDAERQPPPPEVARLVPGGSFIHDAASTVPAVWGRDDAVLWAEGEPLIVTGPPGVGKTTLGGQVITGRLGLIPDVLGFPVTPGKRVLYLAMDRPAQIARALGRLLRQFPREILDEKIVFWRGPPPADLAVKPEMLHDLAVQAGADTVVLDSLKDAAIGLSKDEVGQGINRAMQLCVADGIEVIAYHHQTKRGAGGEGKPNSLADMYGSVWISAGAGSVVLLWGNAGDPVIELSHLKQPAAEVGPLQLVTDPVAGTMAIQGDTDVLDLLREGPRTVSEVAVAIYGSPEPTRAQVAKARRKLQRLVALGLVVQLTEMARVGGGGGGADGSRFGATVRPDPVHAASNTGARPVHVSQAEPAFPQVKPGARDHFDTSAHDFGARPVHAEHENDVSAGQPVHAAVYENDGVRSLMPAIAPPLGGAGAKHDDLEIEHRLGRDAQDPEAWPTIPSAGDLDDEPPTLECARCHRLVHRLDLDVCTQCLWTPIAGLDKNPGVS